MRLISDGKSQIKRSFIMTLFDLVVDQLADLGSISSTFYGQLLRQSSYANPTGVQQRAGVNFTKILCAAFTYVSCEHSFFVPTF
jgi:hypothetical protein